jgi:hypothetical protein
MEPTIKALHKNIAEWMAGPTGAAILHLFLILALLLLVDFSKEPPPDSTEFTYIPVEDTITLDKPPPLEPIPTEFTSADPEFKPVVNEPDRQADEDLFNQDPLTPPQEPFMISEAPSPISIQGIFAGKNKGRIGTEARAQAGEKYSNNWYPYTDVAVGRALEWLRLNQNKDGSWGEADHAAMTGLALLTYLAHGETTASEPYGETVTRAIRYLMAQQNEFGEFDRVDTTGGTYSQAICVYAISEAFGMTRIPELREVMEKGVAVLLAGQQASGGFDYRFKQSERRDTSLGGWCSQALKAAYIARAKNPGLRNAMELAVADMKAAQKEDGQFYYTHKGSHTSEGITAVAVLSMQLLGHGQAREVRKGLSALKQTDCDWQHPPAWPMYSWYYISQIKFHQGGEQWVRWNNEFAPQFIKSQNPDGSWDSAGGSLKKGTHGREQMHRVYATTLAALTLQVYYRNLPTYQPMEKQAVEPASSGEVTIQVL